MSADKPLTPKKLIRKASSKISAAAFIDAYRTHIRTNFPGAIDLLDQYESGGLLPTPTLQAIKQVIEAHIAEGARKKDQAAIAKFEANKDKPQAVKGSSGSGKYSVQFFIKSVNERTGDAIIELYYNKAGIHTFREDLYQKALGLVDRKQNDMSQSVYARIVSIENGKEMASVIPRAESIARINKVGRKPAMRNAATGNSKPQKNYPRARNDHFSVSRG